MSNALDYLKTSILTACGIDEKETNMTLKVFENEKEHLIMIKVTRFKYFSKLNRFDAIEFGVRIGAILNSFNINWLYGTKNILTGNLDMTSLIIKDDIDSDQLSFLFKVKNNNIVRN